LAILILKLRNVVLVTGAFLLLLAVVWYVGFDRNISLPNLANIRKIEVCQNDFKQRAQQITYIEEDAKIQKIYDFIDKRKKGWEPMLYSPTAPVVMADFYGPNGVLFELYLMKSSNFLLRNSNGTYLKSLRNEEVKQFFDLLGVQPSRLVYSPLQRRSL
jgi:hypothetical protein